MLRTQRRFRWKANTTVFETGIQSMLCCCDDDADERAGDGVADVGVDTWDCVRYGEGGACLLEEDPEGCVAAAPFAPGVVLLLDLLDLLGLGGLCVKLLLGQGRLCRLYVELLLYG